ncbi:hypothetical protein [Bradyrhizobium sp. SSUT77]|uniref:hypothetical protein n=1 Tax=Bradyrhizobium sp. SSUT77 TaxID=3040603 RepID=UPI002449143A|nr:hypothetical protein [Bradyrhizobium sp. SSUT77]MDH2341108.1 hypothetical protein [Bradyrhizobium sp. SSUT77]
MPTASPVLTRRFRDIVARIGAAFRQQREIDAQRALRRYRHLLEQPHETLLLSEIIPASNEEDISGNAYGSDAREHAGRPKFERA